jgi:hypothetical protein
LAISRIHSKTDDDDDAVGEGEIKAENEQFLHQAFFSSSGIGFLWGVCMVTMQLGIIISLMLRSTQRQR